MGLFTRKKKPFSIANWHLHGWYDTKVQMDRDIKKLKKDGFKIRYKRNSKGRYMLQAKAT